jgi:hypothetical protein
MQSNETAIQGSPAFGVVRAEQGALGADLPSRSSMLGQRIPLIAAAVVLLIALPLFSVRVSSGDYGAHIGFTKDLLERKASPPHPLFHLTLIALSGGNLVPAYGLVAFICAASLAAVTWLSALMIGRAGASPVMTILVSVVLAFVLPFPNWWEGDRYVGLVTPNVWHNPTGVFAMPFALGLFMAAVRLLDRLTPGQAALTGLASVLSLLAKPLYFLAFAPAFVLTLLSEVRRMRLAAAARILVLALLPPGFVLLAQYRWLTTDTSVSFLPFEVWRGYVRGNYVGAVLLGIAFPLTVFLLYPLQANGDRKLILAWVALQFGVVMQICFVENGVRALNDNFGWAMIYADHVLFVASAAFLFDQRRDWRRWICLGVLALHGLSGIQYLTLKVA